jgi:hypothetical protein
LPSAGKQAARPLLLLLLLMMLMLLLLLTLLILSDGYIPVNKPVQNCAEVAFNH